MLRFSRQNWMASRCRKRARLCRKARRRAFRFAKLGSSAAPPEAGAAAPQVRLRPGFSGVCCGAGRRCRLPNAPLRKLSAPQRVGDPETREASVRGAVCVHPWAPRRRFCASEHLSARRPGRGPDRTVRASNCLSRWSEAQTGCGGRGWEGRRERRAPLSPAPPSVTGGEGSDGTASRWRECEEGQLGPARPESAPKLHLGPPACERRASV